MANPTRRWDKLPVYGVWLRSDDTPEAGTVTFVLAHRIQRTDERVIYPAGAKVTAKIGDQAGQDADVRTAVRQAWRAQDEAMDGEDFDGAAWDTWWDTVIVPAAIFTRLPILDDPDVIIDPANRFMVTESLDSASGRSGYPIQPLLAHLDLPIPGINLGGVEIPPGTPTAPAPVYAKGIAGGVASLDSTGKVPLEQLPDDVGGGLTSWSEIEALPDAPEAFPTTSTDVTDATTVGRSVLTAASQAAARTAIGAGTSNLTIGSTGSTAKAGNWQPTAADVTDATTVGRSVLTAADAAAARTAIGAGTSNLAIGTTASTAKAGDYQPTAANISDSTATGRSVLTAASATAARDAIGAAAAADLADKATLTADTGVVASGRIIVATTPTPAGMQAGDLVVVIPE